MLADSYGAAKGVIELILVIISAAACLAATTIMYTPRMRSFRYYRPIAMFFLFEALWVIADYVFAQLSPGNVVLPIIHHIGIIALVLFFILNIIFGPDKKTNNSSSNKLARKDKGK